jgi:hypothetical protein
MEGSFCDRRSAVDRGFWHSSEVERPEVRRVGLRAGEVEVGDELVAHVALSLLGERVVLEGIVGRRRLGKSGEHRGLCPVKVWGGVEVSEGRGDVAPVAVSVVDGVEVHVEDLGFWGLERELDPEPDLPQRCAHPFPRP